MGAKIAENDMQLKLRAAQSFLEQGHRVRLTITFNRHQRLEGGQRLQEFVRLVQPFAQVPHSTAAFQQFQCVAVPVSLLVLLIMLTWLTGVHALGG